MLVCVTLVWVLVGALGCALLFVVGLGGALAFVCSFGLVWLCL